ALPQRLCFRRAKGVKQRRVLLEPFLELFLQCGKSGPIRPPAHLRDGEALFALVDVRQAGTPRANGFEEIVKIRSDDLQFAVGADMHNSRLSSMIPERDQTAVWQPKEGHSLLGRGWLQAVSIQIVPFDAEGEPCSQKIVKTHGQCAALGDSAS